jgi:hypothetical protein
MYGASRRLTQTDLQESFLDRRPLHARTLGLCKKWLGDERRPRLRNGARSANFHPR